MKIIFKIFLIIFCLTTKAKTEIINKLKNTPITKFDLLVKNYAETINNRLSEYIIETDGFRVKLENIKLDFSFDEELQLFIINLYTRADQNRYSKKKINIKNRDCNIIRNRIFTKKYGYGMLFSKKPTEYFDKNFIINNSLFLLDDIDLSTEEKKEIIKKTYITIELDHPAGNQKITCKGPIYQVPLK